MSGLYLDHAATTPLSSAALDAMLPYLREQYANPSSAHRPGLIARRAIETAREQIASCLGVPPGAVVFTSGGTEANNLAIKGRLFARSPDKRHVVTTAVEHPCVRQSLADLATAGATVTAVKPEPDGLVDPQAILAAVRADTALVAMIHGQNEVGALEPVAAVARLLRERALRVALHVDAVQSFGKVPLPLDGLASVALSAHKVYGPKGIGALVLLEKTPLVPLMSGGGQEHGLRSGTENVAGIVGFGRAVAELPPPREAERTLRALRDRATAGIASVPGARVLGEFPATLPHIVCFALEGIPGEVVLHHLERDGLYVSTGSACHAKTKSVSTSALAHGLSETEVRGMVRASFGLSTTPADVDRLLAALQAIARELEHARVG